MDITVTRRGGDVPDQGDVNEAGLPVTRVTSIGKNAWLLWRRAYTQAQKNPKPVARDGVAGWEWEGALVELEREIWPEMVSDQRDPRTRPATTARNHLRKYLRESGNLTFADGGWRGRGRLGGVWWIRDQWNDTIPAVWQASHDAARAARAEVTTTWACPVCHEPFDGRVSLNEHRAQAHPVNAPELPGDSLLADVLKCMGDEPRMHNVDLTALLQAGNYAAYGDTGVIMIGKMLRDVGVYSRQLRIGNGPNSETVVRAGIEREDVVAALAREEDAEAAVFVAEAEMERMRMRAASSPATMLSEAVSAILLENGELRRQVEERDAALEQLRREPVSQELINKALAAKDARIAELERKYAAARKLIGLG